MPRGWHNHPHEHALAARGIPTRGRAFSCRGERLSTYFHMDTGMPVHRNMMENPEYFRERKGISWEIVWMSPDEYVQAIDRGFRHGRREHGYDDISQRLAPSHLEKIQATMEELVEGGEKMDMPSLRYYVSLDMNYENPHPYFSQEGHHRAVAAKELGEALIPVFVEYPTDLDEIAMVWGHMTGPIKEGLDE